jgi:hypothetical protein
MRKTLAMAAAGTTIAAGMLSVAATANAAPLPQPHKAPTSLSVTVSAPVIKAHGRDTVAGTLASGHKALAKEVVWLEWFNGRKLVPAEAALTNGRGVVAFAVAPKASTTYELVFAGTRTLAASHSHAVTVRVAR